MDTIQTTKSAVSRPAGRKSINALARGREYLTPDEIDLLLKAAKQTRHGLRDRLMLLLAYRHALRAAEVCDLRWDQINLTTATMHVNRLKNGTPSAHPLQ